MQTFVPSTNLTENFERMDPRRMLNQRRETLTVLNLIFRLRALQKKGLTYARAQRVIGGWAKHPVVDMWYDYVPFLQYYLNENLGVCERLGYTNWIPFEDIRPPVLADALSDGENGHVTQLGESIKAKNSASFYFDAWSSVRVLRPWWWFGAIHESHRLALLHKEPEYYESIYGETEKEPVVAYVWPGRARDPRILQLTQRSVETSTYLEVTA